eukprot:11208071-Karenia_brevis.AAC.2
MSAELDASSAMVGKVHTGQILHSLSEPMTCPRGLYRVLVRTEGDTQEGFVTIANNIEPRKFFLEVQLGDEWVLTQPDPEPMRVAPDALEVPPIGE